MPSIRREMEAEGYAFVREFLDADEIARLLAAMQQLDPDGQLVRRGGLRHVASRIPEIARLAAGPELRSLVEAVAVNGAEVHLARSLWFDKTAAANWNVAWHQDLTLAVKERIETPGFTGWSLKDGAPHVQPPVEVLERMVALRLHLDPCGPENGALRVLPGSHRHGRLTDEAITRWRDEVPEVLCTAQAGDALLMHPLLLHASSAAVRPAHRRVLHLEFGLGRLPNGLQWYDG